MSWTTPETGERVFLTADEAIARLADGDTIRAYRRSGPVILGADWPREEVIDFIRRHWAEESVAYPAVSVHTFAVFDGTAFTFFEAKGEPPT